MRKKNINNLSYTYTQYMECWKVSEGDVYKFGPIIHRNS